MLKRFSLEQAVIYLTPKALRGSLACLEQLMDTKADGDSARLARITRQQYSSALRLLHHASGFWTPQVMTCSALQSSNIDAVWDMVLAYRAKALAHGSFDSRRASQNRDWMHQLIQQMLLLKLHTNPEVKTLLPVLEEAVAAGRTTAYAAAREVIAAL